MERADIRNQWEGAAAGWAKWENIIAGSMEPATRAMLSMGQVTQGDKVLDLACGAGSQTLAAAKLVGPGGYVLATDISENMLSYVRQQAKIAQLAQISTLLAAAEEIDLPAKHFDAVICRLGLMLFSDPSRAVRKAREVLKPGGRFAAVVFTVPATNPFMAKPMQVLLRHTGKGLPEPGQPGIFALGAPGVIEGLLTNNGFEKVETQTCSVTLNLPSASEALIMMQEAFGAYRAVLKDSPPAVRKAAWAEVEDVLKAFETGEGFEAPLEVKVVAGSSQA